MNLLGAKLYDPAAAVTKAATALLAMTALDTANLRLTFTVPASGMVRVFMRGAIHGAATAPQVLLGILNGATVVARVAPMVGVTNLAATSLYKIEADFVVTGLAPGASLTWDAAYGVETLVAATGIKYGGPNNTTASDAFGGFAFEIWDPCPIYLAASTPTSTVDAKLNTIDDLIDTEIAALATAVATVDGRLDTEIPAILADTGTLTGRLTAPRAAAMDNLDATISSRLAAAGYTAPDNATIGTLAGRLTAGRATNLDNLDAAVSSRLATVGYTAPDNAGIAATKLKTDAIVVTSGKVEVQVKGLDALSFDASVMTTAAMNAIANQLLDLANTIETGLTVRQALRAALAVLAGEADGAGSGSERFWAAVANHKARVTVTADPDGNRTSITYDLT